MAILFCEDHRIAVKCPWLTVCPSRCRLGIVEKGMRSIDAAIVVSCGGVELTTRTSPGVAGQLLDFTASFVLLV